MNINHLDLQVPDVLAAATFFTRYFDFTQTSTPGALSIAILSNDAGFVLVLQKSYEARYPENFHIGFMVPEEDTVRRLHSRIKADRAETTGDVFMNGRGVMFYCKAPGDILVECSYHKPQS
jgi:catechol 2,3-dioxygenase-like lactoylglutathione lyase family enzyme